MRKLFKKFMAVLISLPVFTVLLGLCPIKTLAAGSPPATPNLSHDNWDGRNDFTLEMNMWWGTNGTSWKLYENNKLIIEEPLKDNSPNAQKATYKVASKPKGSYTYKCELINASGKTLSNSITVNVTSDAPNPPIETIPDTPNKLTAIAENYSSILIRWDASTSATSYELEIDNKIVEVTTTSYTHNNLAPKSTHNYKVRAKNKKGASNWSNLISATTPDKPTNPDPDPTPVPSKILVGYWHNFDNGSTNIKLRDISPKFDVIDVAFAESNGDFATMVFSPYNATKDEFISDIKYLQSKGKKIILSIGGQNGSLELTSKAAEDKFVNSMSQLIATYGFNGIDIDLEGGSVSLLGGDTNFKAPTTPKIVNLISAIKRLRGEFGPNFMLTMAPEIAYVQGGYSSYGGPWGAYLPVIYGLRNELSFIHVQHYNAGSAEAPDGNTYAQGTADFQVAMADMLISGFPIARDTNNIFPGLPAEKVVIGLPACSRGAGGGYITPNEMKKALDYLILGKSFGGKYVLKTPSGYKNFRGLMTWSINWDAASNSEFSNNYRSYFDSITK